MRTPHTSCFRGTRVRIILKNGQIIDGKFKERTGNFIILFSGLKVRAGEVKAFMIVKD